MPRLTRSLIAAFLLGLATARAVGAGRAADLSLHLYDRGSARPVAQALIRCSSPVRMASSDSTGVAEIAGLDPGPHRFQITHPGYDPLDTTLVVTAVAGDIVLRLRPRVWSLDEVVVTGTRTPHLLKDAPVATAVIGRKDFARTGARSADQALAWLVGASVQDDLGGQGAVLRGLGEDRVLLLVDGDRALGRVRGSIDLAQFSLGDLDRIEVVKGPASTLYGSDAIGGVINLITRRPDDTPRGVDLYGSYGSHRAADASVTFSGRPGGVPLLLTTRVFRTAGFDLDPSSPQTNGQESTKRLNLEAATATALSARTRVSGSARAMVERKTWLESEEFPPDLTFIYGDRETNHRYDGSVALEHRTGDRLSMAFRTSGTIYDHDWVKDTSERNARVDESESTERLWDASYNAVGQLRPGHRITFGIDRTVQRLRSSEIDAGERSEHAWDTYLQYELARDTRFAAVPGVRYEHHTAFGDRVNPSVSLMAAVSSRLRLRGQIASGFRAPSLKEQFYTFDHTAAGYVVYGGAVPLPPGLSGGPARGGGLREERSLSSSLSAELSLGRFGVHRLGVYDTRLRDLIDFQLLGFTPTYWRGVYAYGNIGRAALRGCEWESRIRIGPATELALSYDYLWSRDLGTDRPLLHRPASTLKGIFSVTAERLHAGGTLSLRYTSRQLWVSLANTGEQESAPVWASSRLVTDMYLYRDLREPLRAFVRLENLLNQTNVTYGYWPGFTLAAGLAYHAPQRSAEASPEDSWRRE